MQQTKRTTKNAAGRGCLKDIKTQLCNFNTMKFLPPRWWHHLIVVRGFEYTRDPESYTSSSIATGRASLAGQVKV
jgi:hypothetical protein